MNMSATYMKRILDSSDPESLSSLLSQAEKVRLEHLGNEVYMRGLIEFSNICRADCFYCGLRKSNQAIKRYHISAEEILEKAEFCMDLGIPSIALQSGEISSDREVDFVARVVSLIREQSTKDGSAGLGITLSIGELTYAQYRRLFDAGAHRYLLRIESSDRSLFQSIHPAEQDFDKRLECLDALKDIGYQVGTGIMIGLPGQTTWHLVQDLYFFVQRDIDMLGMGPYLPHPDTPLYLSSQRAAIDPFIGTIKMLALARLLMPDINMVVSTALQTIDADGLKLGMRAGGNVIMPLLTPEEYRGDYSIYINKRFRPFYDLQSEVEAVGYQLAFGKWGDPLHYYRNRKIPYPGQRSTGEGCSL